MKNSQNEEYYLQKINKSARLLKNVPKELRADKEFINKAIELIEKDWCYLAEYAAQELMDDRDIVMKVVTKSPMFLMYLSEGLKDDKEIALTALKCNKNVFNCLGFNLKEELREKASIDEKINYLEKFILKDQLIDNLPKQPSLSKKTKI